MSDSLLVWGVSDAEAKRSFAPPIGSTGDVNRVHDAREGQRTPRSRKGTEGMMDASKRPWPTETMPVPQRLAGMRVVAAIKLPSGPGLRPHLYMAVCEDEAASAYTFYRMVFVGDDGLFHAEEGTYHLDYDDAIVRLVLSTEAIWGEVEEILSDVDPRARRTFPQSRNRRR